MRSLLFTLALLLSISGFSKTTIFTGQIDQYPITLIINDYYDGIIHGIYVYDKYDTPIILEGKVDGTSLVLDEKDEAGNFTATLQFSDYKAAAKTLTGQWTSLKAGKKRKIALQKSLEFDAYDEAGFESQELLQAATTDKQYFKLVLKKEKEEAARVVGVKVFEKQTDQMLQAFEVDCTFMGIESISIGDYNFDGQKDFAVFEESYSGPNTSSLYFLKEANKNSFLKSDYEGISLTFDPESKIITEYNQCCGGKFHMEATYNVVDNQMVLIKRVCMEYDEALDDFVEKECE